MGKWIAIAIMVLYSCGKKHAEVSNDNIAKADSLYNKASLLITKNQLHQKDDELAFDLLNQAIELNPINVNYNLNRAAVKINLLMFESAIEDLEIVLRSDPKNILALLNVALCNNHLKQYEKSMIYSTRAIDINPSYGYAYYIRSDSHLYQNQMDDMCDDLDKAWRYKYAPAANRISQYCNKNIKKLTF